SHDIPIHFDYHSLTLGVKANHERFRRPIEDWRLWAFMVDTVQLNEEEIGGLSVERLTEKQTAGHLLTLSVKGAVVTKGVQGVTLYYNDHKKVIEKNVAGIKLENPRDATGCGDVFGAAKVGHIGIEGLSSLAKAAQSDSSHTVSEQRASL
ncbi:MAG: PfkB protein, partial [Bacteroidetes bacterium]|nr:PfkB protein [Bacteroidota bacterium]